MDESPTPVIAELEVLAKSVQELSLKSEKLPENFIYRGCDGGLLDAPLPVVHEIPVVDLSLLTPPSETIEELEKLQSGLSSWGCIQVVNHGMTSSFLDQVRQITKQFFELPMEEKKKYSREIGDIEGYGNDMILSEHQTLDWTDRLYLTIYPEDHRRFKFWPENPKAFSEVLKEYTEKIRKLTEVIFKAMARSLNLEEDCFWNQYGERAIMNARFNYYPPCPWPDLVLGIKPHADGSAITFLLQDNEVEGLQICKDNQWFKVPIVPHALLVNVGDQVEIMSNGILKSPVHRVVTNSEKERSTVAVFCIPEPEKEIGPIDKLVNESRPRLYKTVKSYVEIYFEHYQQGKRPIDAAKI
ncbi:2-oxoglutarate (2OG) and Fe(II)-dependent oxygenase superfamily protein [Quillaja saponaria]|uniref:2-oxoglutarate (2OG) and Fe(II)-dependent oxygenase superfamily protein n=1 Tax=Quillaja saponaria TaxID=32244 RepID=A0AAD7LGW7_QUISA|nr:2-oxoglutarate (2OG) and Fe(II)-dependent oxygenase superfamily protein [Quillaja saponaria]